MESHLGIPVADQPGNGYEFRGEGEKERGGKALVRLMGKGIDDECEAAKQCSEVMVTG